METVADAAVIVLPFIEKKFGAYRLQNNIRLYKGAMADAIPHGYADCWPEV